MTVENILEYMLIVGEVTVKKWYGGEIKNEFYGRFTNMPQDVRKMKVRYFRLITTIDIEITVE